MSPETLLEMAARAGVEVSVTPTGMIELSGPEHATRILAFDAKPIKPALLAHLSRLSRSVPLDRDRKNACKSTPVPPVPPVPPKNGTTETVPVVPENQTELKGSSFQIDRREKGHSVYEYRLTDKPETWLIMVAPGCTIDQARHALTVKFGPDRLLDVLPAHEKDRDKRDKRDSHCSISNFPVPAPGQAPGQTGTDRDRTGEVKEAAA